MQYIVCMNEEIQLTDEDLNFIVENVNLEHDPTKNKVDALSYYYQDFESYGQKSKYPKNKSLKSPYGQITDFNHVKNNMTREIEALKARIKELEEENAELKIDIETYKNMES